MNNLRLIAVAVLLYCFCCPNTLYAQGWSARNLDEMSRWEIGLSGGGALYFGDLTPDKRNYFNDITPSGGLLMRYNLGQNFSVRGNLCAAQLSGSDSKYSKPEWRQHRNFSFTTTLYEVSLMMEYDVLKALLNNDESKWGVYAFVGLGLYYTDPKRNFSNINTGYFDHSDKALTGLDADKKDDPSHVAVVMPIGLGVRYEFNKRFSLFAEGSIRQGFDDKIDGFSQSVSSGKSDAYSLFSVGVNMRFKRRGWWN